jgi:hypothetical protein
MQDIEWPCSPTIAPTPPASVEELKATILGRGWCLHRIGYLAQLHQLPVLRRFATLDRRAHRVEDYDPYLEQTHCIAYNTGVTKDHHIRHATNFCRGNGCYVVKVPYKELISVVGDGGVPLVSIRDSLTYGLSLRVTANNSAPAMLRSVMSGPMVSAIQLRMLFPSAKSNNFNRFCTTKWVQIRLLSYNAWTK